MGDLKTVKKPSYIEPGIYVPWARILLAAAHGAEG